jgi:hypothetical protein
MADIAITETPPLHPGDTIHFDQEGGDVAQPDELLFIYFKNDLLGQVDAEAAVTADGAGSFAGSVDIPVDLTPDASWYLFLDGDQGSHLTSVTFAVTAVAAAGGGGRGLSIGGRGAGSAPAAGVSVGGVFKIGGGSGISFGG